MFCDCENQILNLYFQQFVIDAPNRRMLDTILTQNGTSSSSESLIVPQIVTQIFDNDILENSILMERIAQERFIRYRNLNHVNYSVFESFQERGLGQSLL